MAITACKTGELPAGLLEGLCARVYAAYPAYAAALAAELAGQLAAGNPSPAAPSREHFWVPGPGGAAAHACAVTDPRLPPGSGLVGFFEAASPAAAREALDAACAALRARGVRTAYGPVNDDIWHRYGAACSGDAPPYTGEPFTPAAYAAYFREAGFEPFDRRLTTEQAAAESRFARDGSSRAALEGEGFVFEEISPAGLAGRAAEIHSVATRSFADSPLFVPVTREEFLHFAAGLAGRTAGSALVLARDRGGKPAGFILGMPDALSGGEAFVFKTVAVLPGYRNIGLGRALFHTLVRGRREGRYIYSTMHSGNAGIASLAARGSRTLREYLTFRRPL